jgi:hypothetical protein
VSAKKPLQVKNLFRPSKVKFSFKRDWCHVCGSRNDTKFAELWISENSEHDKSLTEPWRYVRVCCRCVGVMAEKLNSFQANETSPSVVS